MTENTPQSPYEPNTGGPMQPPAGGPAQPPAYGGGAQPPAYGGPGGYYGAQQHGSFTVGEALGFAWKRFTGNWLFWVLFVLLSFVVVGIFNAGSFSNYQEINEAVMRGDISGRAASGASFGGSLLGLIGSLVNAVLGALGINAALREVSGEKATWGRLFKVDSYGMIILAALLLLVAGFIGLIPCGLGLIALAIFAPFTYHNVVDRGMNAWAAFTSSFRLVGQNFGAVFLLELALLGITIVGAIVCGLGLFVAVPLSVIALAFAFRRITGGPVTSGPVASGPAAYGPPAV